MSFYAKKLIQRLLSMGVNLPEGVEIKRTHAGYQQRSAGAFSWTFAHKDPKFYWCSNIGSTYPVKELAKADKISIYRHDGDTEFFPESEKKK